MASTALSTAAYAVIRITSQLGTVARIWRRRSRPLTSGIRKSTIARSAGLRISARSASDPLAQVMTSNPAFAARRSITRSTGCSSSTTRSDGRAVAVLSAGMMITRRRDVCGSAHTVRRVEGPPAGNPRLDVSASRQHPHTGRILDRGTISSHNRTILQILCTLFVACKYLSYNYLVNHRRSGAVLALSRDAIVFAVGSV